MDLDSFHRLKKKIDNASKEKERATGVLQTLLERLRKEFGVSDKESASILLERLKQKMDKQEKELVTAIEESEKKFSVDWPEKE